MALLISRFQDCLDMEDVRHYDLSSVRENVSRVMDRNKGVSPNRTGVCDWGVKAKLGRGEGGCAQGPWAGPGAREGAL